MASEAASPSRSPEKGVERPAQPASLTLGSSRPSKYMFFTWKIASSERKGDNAMLKCSCQDPSLAETLSDSALWLGTEFEVVARSSSFSVPSILMSSSGTVDVETAGVVVSDISFLTDSGFSRDFR
jgi:hypothetical protein